MYEPKLEKDIRCPLEYGLSVFGGKWKPRILGLLGKKGALRYSAIREEIADITDSVLTSALKELIKDNMIERQQFDEIPPRVEYRLTEKGRSVIPVLHAICEWAGPFCDINCENPLPQCLNCIYYL